MKILCDAGVGGGGAAFAGAGGAVNEIGFVGLTNCAHTRERASGLFYLRRREEKRVKAAHTLRTVSLAVEDLSNGSSSQPKPGICAVC